MWLYEVTLYLAFGVPLLVYVRVQDYMTWRYSERRKRKAGVPPDELPVTRRV